jgi:putative transposase
MPDYRRVFIPGGTYFFTVNALDRRSDLFTAHISLLRETVNRVRHQSPFEIDAWVVLPDHMHAIWTLPPGDADYAGRWRAIKTQFSKAVPKQSSPIPTPLNLRTGERGLWQRRFWEHAIRDERDFHAHVDYVHINPLKHGLVTHLRDWPYSSFHRYVKNGVYPCDWAASPQDMPAGEP